MGLVILQCQFFDPLSFFKFLFLGFGFVLFPEQFKTAGIIIDGFLR